jgi:hypothetical protein
VTEHGLATLDGGNPWLKEDRPVADRLPPTSFCALARSGPELANYEEVLTRQHDAGVLQVIDRGAMAGTGKDPIRRWRIRWEQGNKTLRLRRGRPAVGCSR